MDRDIALGIVRELYGTQPFSVRNALSELIPGLVRKEDRAIKETLKELVVNGGTSCYVNGIHKDEILAWLEKQGKQKELNFVEILKHYPKETELYSPLYGKLWLAMVNFGLQR